MIGNRMVDIQPPALYEDLCNTAATEFAKGELYDGSYEALALKQAFVLGANTSRQFHGRLTSDDLLRAVMAGRKWGLTEQSHRRMVVTGIKLPHYPTISIKVDTSEPDKVAAARLPMWGDPKAPLPVSETDGDLLRKQRIEDQL